MLAHLRCLCMLLGSYLLLHLFMLGALLRHLLLVYLVLLCALLCHLLLARLRLLCVLCFQGLAVCWRLCHRLWHGQPAGPLMGRCRGCLGMGVWKRLHGCHGTGADHRLHARADWHLSRVDGLALAECVAACRCYAGCQRDPVAVGELASGHCRSG